ncbi:MAG: KUP/HAK/KT family potassium transporter [Solirubrobacteraceae bacterium]
MSVALACLIVLGALRRPMSYRTPPGAPAHRGTERGRRRALRHPPLARSRARARSTIDVDQISYFLSQMTIVATAAPGMSTWRKRLFLTMAHNAASPARYFGLPDDRTVTIGGASPSERLARSSSCASRAAASGGHPRDRHSGFAVALAHYLRGGGQRRG